MGTLTIHRDGAFYNPATNTWRMMSAPPPALGARGAHVAVWTGTEMIVWGGRDILDQAFNDGARYDPSASSWTYLPAPPFAFSPRWDLKGVWTGTEMIVWGGQTFDGTPLGDGAAYNPSTNTWRRIAPGGPSARANYVMTWTGTEVALFGGGGATDTNLWLLLPTDASWRSIPTTLAGRSYQQAQVWTGSDLIIWGGLDSGNAPLDTGALVDPATGSVSAMTTSGTPAGAQAPAYAWTGESMIVWGGTDGTGYPNTGARYYPR